MMIRRNQYSVLDTEYILEEGVKKNGSGAFTEKVPSETPHIICTGTSASEHRYHTRVKRVAEN